MTVFPDLVDSIPLMLLSSHFHLHFLGFEKKIHHIPTFSAFFLERNNKRFFCNLVEEPPISVQDIMIVYVNYSDRISFACLLTGFNEHNLDLCKNTRWNRQKLHKSGLWAVFEFYGCKCWWGWFVIMFQTLLRFQSLCS